MSKCPICQTEYAASKVCPKCGFTEMNKIFINRDDAIIWAQEKIIPYRKDYWKRLIEFEIDDTRLVRFSPQEMEQVFAKVVVPYGITDILEDAFAGKSINEVILPNTVRSIGDNAFQDTRLRRISIPPSVVQIGSGVFRGCHSIHLVIPKETKIIGACTFDCGRPRIFCEASQKPETWSEGWYDCVWPEKWGVFWKGSWDYQDGKPTLNDTGRAQLADM